jgi:hypothetical protein
LGWTEEASLELTVAEWGISRMVPPTSVIAFYERVASCGIVERARASTRDAALAGVATCAD